jgi:hypothetical protein
MCYQIMLQLLQLQQLIRETVQSHREMIMFTLLALTITAILLDMVEQFRTPP